MFCATFAEVQNKNTLLNCNALFFFISRLFLFFDIIHLDMRRSVLAALVLMVVAVTSQTIDDLASVEDYYDSLDVVSSFSDDNNSSTISIGTPGVGYHTAYTKIGGVQTDKIDISRLEMTRTEYQLGTLSEELLQSITSLQKRVDVIMQQNKTYTVTSTTTKPPNNNTHYYYSLAPYSWPNCTGIKKVVSEWTQCPWDSIDGKVRYFFLCSYGCQKNFFDIKPTNIL